MPDGSFVLQKYNIIEKLAAGGMAEIYLAVRKENHFQNKFYVIKRILPALADNPEYLVYLKDEAKALSLLDHQNIIGFYDFFYENDQFYLVMEYLNGKTLREMFSDLAVKKQTLSTELLLHIVMEVAAGLDYAHSSFDFVLDKSLNLVHRDLNPQNIMISYDGNVKIIDFGISKFDVRDDFTKTGMLKGKFGYMSPEQVDGLEIDSRTDIFALGILAWELLTNKRLFDGEDDFEKYSKIKNHQLVSVCQYNSAVPKDLDRVVMKALAPSAADRYQTAAEMRHDISMVLAKHFPNFRSGVFKKTILKIYGNEFQKHVEKLRQQFQKSAIAEEENTKTSREFYMKQAQKEDLNQRRSSREYTQHGLNIAMPDSFELNINKSKLKLEVPNHEPEKPPLSFEEKQAIDDAKPKVKKTRHTKLDPERYSVQAGHIKISGFHAWINSYGPRMKFLVYAFSLCGISWGLMVTYEQGYLHLFFNTAYRLIKNLI